MRAARDFVNGLEHAKFMQILKTFCQRRDVAMLMTYGVSCLTASDKASMREALMDYGVPAADLESDENLRDFCTEITARAMAEKG